MMNNISVNIIDTIIRHAMSSESKANVAALIINENEDITIINDIEELVHPQQATLLQTDD